MRQDDQEQAVPLRIGGWLPPATPARPVAHDDVPAHPATSVAGPDPVVPVPPAPTGEQAGVPQATALGRPRRRAVVMAAAMAVLAAIALRFGPPSETSAPEAHLPQPAAAAAQPLPAPPSAQERLERAPGATTASASQPAASPSGSSPSQAERAVRVSYEAERDGNVMGGRTRPVARSGASNGQVVWFIGNGKNNFLRFTGVTVPDTDRYAVRVQYVSPEPRQAVMVVNGSSLGRLDFPATPDSNTVRAVTFRLSLNAGTNTIEVGNQYDWAPDFDRIDVTR